MKKTYISNILSSLGEVVTLQGWVETRRDHGKLIFLDIRDSTGIVQTVINSSEAKEAFGEAQYLGNEFVVEIEGKVNKRPKNLINPDLPTGALEVAVSQIKIVNPSKEPPFPIKNDGRDIDEALRLKYRYLDLRRPRLQKNIQVRSQYVQAAREYLFSKSFIEIETPMLTKSTPEGSRDFVVPSRLNPGKFFALPQSPQQYKQLLMVGGFERYFQIARCLRDEDPRADRAFEHTQIDLEMSFATREDIMGLVEEMTVCALKKIGGKIAKKPFPVFTYSEVLQKFGSDKFDLRNDQEREAGVLSFAWVVDFPFFEKNSEAGWTFTHNPFSQPVSKEHEEWLLNKKNIGQIITSQYDLVCNGLEVAGGSIRSHQPKVLEAVFNILGYSHKEIEEKFGHMLEALRFGAPPHGGCAQGFERLLMAYFNEDYLREVQAFPQTGSGRTSVMQAPSKINSDQLKELGLKLVRPKHE